MDELRKEMLIGDSLTCYACRVRWKAEVAGSFTRLINRVRRKDKTRVRSRGKGETVDANGKYGKLDWFDSLLLY